MSEQAAAAFGLAWGLVCVLGWIVGRLWIAWKRHQEKPQDDEEEEDPNDHELC